MADGGDKGLRRKRPGYSRSVPVWSNSLTVDPILPNSTKVEGQNAFFEDDEPVNPASQADMGDSYRRARP